MIRAQSLWLCHYISPFLILLVFWTTICLHMWFGERTEHVNVKIAISHGCQKLFLAKSSRASLIVQVPLARTSPVNGCSLGSTSIPYATSWSNLANRSRILSSLRITYPPYMHCMAWSIVNDFPQWQGDIFWFIAEVFQWPAVSESQSIEEIPFVKRETFCLEREGCQYKT